MAIDNPLPRYYELLKTAQSGNEAQQAHDLHSNDLASVTLRNKLIRENYEAQRALIIYVEKNQGLLMKHLLVTAQPFPIKKG